MLSGQPKHGWSFCFPLLIACRGVGPQTLDLLSSLIACWQVRRQALGQFRLKDLSIHERVRA